eukprot:g1564.t1
MFTATTLISLLLVVSVRRVTPARPSPHILFVMSDDVGWADVSFTEDIVASTSSPLRNIPTPRIDALANEGIVLTQYYTHSTCTPSRASFMTGRYAGNTGLNCAMLPGSVAGLEPDMMTLPRFLREHGGYRAHAIGKHHLGHAKWSQTPVGLGFETHVGSYLWSSEYYRKGLWELPWIPFTLDWVRANENGSYAHYAEPEHSTDAITREAIERMRQHVVEEDGPDGRPLFLYVAYTAAHAPLEPAPREIEEEEKDGVCTRFYGHRRRRRFCQVMRGLDRSVGELANRARAQLVGRRNVLFIFSSDNGGATWFGGLNAPLRSGKTQAFEGGVRVPTFFLDLGAGSVATVPTTTRRPQGRQRFFRALSHVSDWLPTLAGFAKIDPDVVASLDLDGHDMSDALTGETTTTTRTEILHEMYYGATSDESLFPEDLVALRVGRWKMIATNPGGGFRDEHYYYHRADGRDRLNSSDTTWITFLANGALDALESFYHDAESKVDTIRDLAVHLGVHALFRALSARSSDSHVRLYDIESDPCERRDISGDHPEIVNKLLKRANTLRARRPEQQKYWLTVDRDTVWPSTLKTGDCAANPAVESADECRFAHPWIDDDVDLSSVELVFGASAVPFLREVGKRFLVKVGLPAVLALGSAVWVIRRRREGR